MASSFALIISACWADLSPDDYFFSGVFEINPIAGAVVDTHFRDIFSHRTEVAGVAFLIV
ncbi:MAG: hypothetical protein LBU85_07285 [Treponema sp.]|nr:hypothetical protein [Treponema sp.]